MKTTFPLATYSASDCSGKELAGSCCGEGAKWEEGRSLCKNVLLRDFPEQDRAPGIRTKIIKVGHLSLPLPFWDSPARARAQTLEILCDPG